MKMPTRLSICAPFVGASFAVMSLAGVAWAGPTGNALGAVANSADELKVLGEAVEQLDELDNLRGLNTLDDLEYPRTLDNLNLNQALPDNIGKLPDLNGAGQLDDAVNALPGAGDYGKLPDFNAVPDNGYGKLKPLDDAPAANLTPDTNKLPGSPSEYGKVPDFANRKPGGGVYDTVPTQNNKLPGSPSEYGQVPDLQNRLPGAGIYENVPNGDYGKLPPPATDIGSNGYTKLGQPLPDYGYGPPERLSQIYPAGGEIVPKEALLSTGEKIALGGATFFVVAGTGVGATMAVQALTPKKEGEAQ